MHCYGIVQSSACQGLGLKVGFVDDARRAATPHVIDCHDLSREVLGGQEFEKRFSERREWCRERCPKDHEIEPIRDERMRPVGRQFRFASDVDAALFKTLFS